MVVQAGLPSLEDLPPHQRSTTVAALRRGQISISEPVPWANSGPSPILQSPSTSTFATPEVEDEQGNIEHDVPQQSIVAPADVSSRPMFRYSDSQKMPSTSTDLQADPYIPPKTSHGPPLRHKRSSIFMKENDPFLSDSAASSSQRHSSTNESAILTDSSMSPRNPKKRRSGSIKLAWRKIFHKRDKSGSSPISPGRPRGHAYHKSVSHKMMSCIFSNTTRNLLLMHP
jgi:hypothetical protein